MSGDVLCSQCLLVAGEPPASKCIGCSALTNNYRTCSSCVRWLRTYAVYAAAPYSGVYEQIVRALKFDVRRPAAAPMARMMAEVTPHLRGRVVVCPIPTAPARIRQRGFDHAKLLAQEYMKVLPKDAVNGEWTLVDAVRRRSNVRQLGSSRSQRIKQMKQALYIHSSGDVKGATVLLVDDVVTTGASLSAAATLLKDAGAKRVYAVVFAQKQ